MRTLLILALALIAFWWLRRSLQDMQRKRRDHAQQARDREKAGAPERMVACAHCGVHVPESDSVQADGQSYCCIKHRRLGVRR